MVTVLCVRQNGDAACPFFPYLCGSCLASGRGLLNASHAHAVGASFVEPLQCNLGQPERKQHSSDHFRCLPGGESEGMLGRYAECTVVTRDTGARYGACDSTMRILFLLLTHGTALLYYCPQRGSCGRMAQQPVEGTRASEDAKSLRCAASCRKRLRCGTIPATTCPCLPPLQSLAADPFASGMCPFHGFQW